MTVNEILSRAGIHPDAPDYGLQFNLACAAVSTFLIRDGQLPAVIAEIQAAYPEEFTAEAQQRHILTSRRDFAMRLSRI